MALRFVSASAQNRFIPGCYALQCKGEQRGEQFTRRSTAGGELLRLVQAQWLFSSLEEGR